MEKKNRKPLDAVLQEICQQHGAGAIVALDAEPIEDVEAIPTGSISLDNAIGIGGIPQGRITEIYGPESAGKTTLALHIAANAQKAGMKVVFIDAEHALDMRYAETLGLDRKTAYISQPGSGEEALAIAMALAESGEIGLIVVDSVAALVPLREVEGDIGDSHVGLQARMMAQAMRKLQPVIDRSQTAVLFINQIRMNIGVMFGNPETTSGGKALKYAASVRLDIRRIGAVKSGEKVIGNRTRVKVVKNKVAPPTEKAEFDILFGKGISSEGDLIDVAMQRGIIQRAGNYLQMQEGPDGGLLRIGHGREKARERIRNEEDLRDFIAKKIREAA